MLASRGASASAASSGAVIEGVLKRPEAYERPRIFLSIPSHKLRSCLSFAVNQAAFGEDPILITRRGRDVAALISISDLMFLDRMKRSRDRARQEKLPKDAREMQSALVRRWEAEMLFE